MSAPLRRDSSTPRTTLALRNQRWALAAILAVYFVSQVGLISKPGLQQDEAGFLIPSMELAQGKPISYGNSVTVLGVHYPTMLGSYTGDSLTIPVALIVRTFGFSLPLVRSLWVICGAGTILFTFLVGRELFGGLIGLFAAGLLAVDPVFWMMSHVGAHASVNMTLDVLGSLFFFLAFQRTGRRPYLFLAMFFTGHGLYTKLAFGYFLIAYLVAFGYAWIRKTLRPEIVNLSNVTVSVSAFLLGCWPLLYETVHSGETWTALKRAFLGRQTGGHDNLQVVEALRARLSQTRSYLLEGRMPIDSIVPGVRVRYDLLMPYLFSAAVVFLLALLVWRGRAPFSKRRIGFVILVFCVFQALIIFSPSTLNYGVYAFIPPFVALIIGLAFGSAYETLRISRYRPLRWLPLAGLAVAWFASAVTLASHYSAVRSTGGRGVWSPAIFDLYGYVSKVSDHEFIALDWGLDEPIYVLSNLRINPAGMYLPFTSVDGGLKLWQNSPPPLFTEEMRNIIRRPRQLFLARPEPLASFKNRLSTFTQVVAVSGARLDQVHRVLEKNGDEAVDVYEVQWPDGDVPVRPGDSPPPRVQRLYPPRSAAAAPMNLQRNGESAIAVGGSGFEPGAVICFDDEPLQTLYANAGLLTAVVPNSFLRSPGEIRVSVRSLQGVRSNTLILTIATAPASHDSPAGLPVQQPARGARR